MSLWGATLRARIELACLCLAVASAGSTLSVALYSSGLPSDTGATLVRAILLFSHIASSGTTAWLVSRAGVRASVMFGGAATGLGFAVLAATSLPPETPSTFTASGTAAIRASTLACACIGTFLAGTGSGVLLGAILEPKTGTSNHTQDRRVPLGLALALAPGFYAMIQSLAFLNNQADFLVLLAVSAFLLNALAAFAMSPVNPEMAPTQASGIHSRIYPDDVTVTQTRNTTGTGRMASTRAPTVQSETSYDDGDDDDDIGIGASVLWNLDGQSGSAMDAGGLPFAEDVQTIKSRSKGGAAVVSFAEGASLGLYSLDRPNFPNSLKLVEISDFGVSLRSPVSTVRRSLWSVDFGEDSASKAMSSNGVLMFGGVSSLPRHAFSLQSLEVDDASEDDFRMHVNDLEMARQRKQVVSLEMESFQQGLASNRGENTVIATFEKNVGLSVAMKSVSFWLLAVSFIWQHGIVYLVNIDSIVNSIYQPSEAAYLLHIQFYAISGGQVLGFIFATFGLRVFPNVNFFLIAFQALSFIPVALLAFLQVESISPTVLTVSASIFGFTFGGFGAPFSPIFAEVLGRYTGQARRIVFGLLLLGVVISQIVIGCFRYSALNYSFKVFFVLQIVSILASIAFITTRSVN
ncbi:hypothetical protein BC830DRAFT_1137386 [Chytriomyces sp. MP71]|nr:hypothetical protein BC830DRAFT_1137386 [Chytriomyces sp. MP71]